MKNKNTITLNGKESTEVTGLLIQELPPISKPLLRTEIEEIDGRDGDIITALGYSAYNKEATIGLYGDFDIDEIIAYFNSEGTVVFSNEPDKYYNYKIMEQIDFERLVRYRTATVTFHVEPFKYSTTELGVVLDPPAENYISIPDFTKTTNGVTLTATDGVVSITGTPTASTEFYLPITPLTLAAGNYTLTAIASGTNPNYCSIRLIGSAPSDVDSFGNRYITLAEGAVVLDGMLNSEKTFGYLWFYMNPGQTFNFAATFEVENKTEKMASGEGTTLALINTAESPFDNFVVKGNTITTGTNPQQILNVKNQAMVRLTSKNLVNVGEISLAPGVERTEGGLRCKIISDTLATYYDGSIVNPLGIYTVSFEARNLDWNTTQLVLDSTASIWGKSGLTLKNDDGEIADESYRTLSWDWKKYSFTVIADTSLPWVDNYAMVLHFSTFTNSPEFELSHFQIEAGPTATDFDGSLPQMYPLDFRIGKNLLNEEFLSIGGLESGTPVGSIAYRVNNAAAPTKVSPNTTYTISAELGETVKGIRVGVQQCDLNAEFLQDNGWQQLASEAYTFTTLDNAEYVKLVFSLSTTSATVTTDDTENTTEYNTVNEWLRGAALQVEEGDTATAYEAYESMELCRVGNYQDYITQSGDDWYVHREVGKIASYNGESITTDFISTTGQLTTGATVYYGLETSNDDKIENEGMVSVLNTIKNQAHTYKGLTIVSSIPGGVAIAPPILAVQATMSSDGGVVNSGNIYSKPKLTLYGSGDIAITLNGIQLFQIALGDNGQITIDTAAMEAYTDSVENLQNRLVTGDYDNFKLVPGENLITFTGTVTRCVIENYSRWL